MNFIKRIIMGTLIIILISLGMLIGIIAIVGLHIIIGRAPEWIQIGVPILILAILVGYTFKK